MTTNINKKFTSHYINDIINNLLRHKYKRTIFYYLEKVYYAKGINIPTMTKDEIMKSDKMINIFMMFSYINKEIKYNALLVPHLNDSIMSKMMELQEEFQDKMDERLKDIFSNIELQIHIYAEHKCKVIATTTNMLCNNKVKNVNNICTTHWRYYKNRESLLIKYLCKDTSSIIIQYIIE